MDIKDIHGNTIPLNAKDIVVPSLGMSLDDAIEQKKIPVPDEVTSSLEQMAETIAVSVGTISSVEVEVSTDATGIPHAEGYYDDGVLSIVLYNIKGDKGETGDVGESGKSAYDLAVEEGYVGTEEEWLASLKGADGSPGADGKDGKDGTNGKDGKDGSITNLAQSVSATDTTNAPSGKAVADYVKANGGTKLVQGSNVTLETLSDGSVKISASLTPGTATDATQVAYTNGQTTTSGGTVADKLTELDGHTDGESINDIDANNDVVEITDDDGGYLAHIDNDGIHAKTIWLQDGKNASAKDLNEYLFENDYTNVMSNLACGNSNNEYKPLVIVHFSDIHAGATNLNRIVKFYNKYSRYIDDVIHTGDQLASTFADDYNYWHTNGGDFILQTIGNHDSAIATNTSINPDRGVQNWVYYNAEECFNRYFVGYENDNWQDATKLNATPIYNAWGITLGGTNVCYYYKDYADKNIRLVVLDCMHWDSTEKTWFDTILEDARTKSLSVVVACHSRGENNYEPCDSTFNSLDGDNCTTWFMANQGAISVQTFIDNGGEFICWINGHTHTNTCGTLRTYPNQFFVTIETASYSRVKSKSRQSYNKSVDAFNVLSIDKSSKTISILRIGSVWDRFGRHSETMTYDYANKKLLSNY